MRTIDKIWLHLRERGAEFEIEKRFKATIVDAEQVDVYLDLIDEDCNRYTVYKGDIEKEIENYYDFEERYEKRYDHLEHKVSLEYYVTKKLVQKIDITNEEN